MAGNKKGRGNPVKGRKSTQNTGRNNGGCRESANLNPDQLQPSTSRGGRTGRRGNNRRLVVERAQGMNENGPDMNNGAHAQIFEDNAIVHMSAEGQDSEFPDDNASQTDSMESEEDVAMNNNANVVLPNPDMRRHLEEGECEDEPAGSSSAKRSRTQPPVTAAANEDLRSYVDQKFSALAKMVELERELSDKNRELDLLRAKGRERNHNREDVPSDLPVHDRVHNYNEGDVRSELTIYKNAVEKSKRGSSSSEDVIDTSNEMETRDGPGEDEEEEMVQEIENPRIFRDEEVDNINDKYAYFTEREMQRAREME